MKNILLSCLFLILSIVGFAQKTDSTYYEAPPVVVSYLKPISVEGGRYYYGNHRLSSGGGGYVLEIPFVELDDPEVNRRFKNYKLTRSISQTLSFLPILYFLYSVNRKSYVSKDYWTIYIGSIVGVTVSDLIGSHQIRKGVERYNLRLERNKFGFSAQPLPNQTVAFGFGLSRSF